MLSSEKHLKVKLNRSVVQRNLREGVEGDDDCTKRRDDDMDQDFLARILYSTERIFLVCSSGRLSKTREGSRPLRRKQNTVYLQ